MKKISLVLCLLALMLLAGCGSSSADEAFAHWDDRVHEDIVGANDAWRYTLSKRCTVLTHRNEEGQVLVTGSYEVPEMQVFHADGTPYSAAAEAMSPAVQAARQVNENFAHRMATWQTNFDEICTLAEQDWEKDGGWDSEYYYTDTVETAFWSNSHIACITLHSDSFTGGEHSMYSRSAVTFDMRTGREITINDMVDDYVALRDTVALEILSQIENGRYVKYYNGELLFDDYAQTIPEWMTRSVFFGPGGMTVVFGAYDIAAYAAGEQAFFISYDLIKPYLNDYGRTVLEVA